MLAQSTIIFGFPTAGAPRTATATTTGGTWYGITCKLFVQYPPLRIGLSDIINLKKLPILPIRKNFRAYRSYWKNIQSYVQTKYPSLPFMQTSNIIVQKKCMILLFRQNVPDYLYNFINQNKRPSLFIQKSAWPYSCNLIRPIFHLILFACTVTVCSISAIIVTSSNLDIINQVNTTIESGLAR